MEDGYVKFKPHLKKSDIVNKKDTEDLNVVREKLRKKDLIGMKENGVGFGNISKRFKKGFLITATSTGGKKVLSSDDYSYVYDYSIDDNELFCKGEKVASSESLTHASIYGANSEIGAVIHIHSIKLWKKYFGKLPTTSKDAEYGTSKLAKETAKKVDGSKGLIIMGGHKEGIIAYGKGIEEAYNELKKIL